VSVKKKKMTNVKKTRDYNMFKRLKGNRPINEAHVNALVRSISLSPETMENSPILVNERMEIIDGQHRVEALRKLEMPVHYTIGAGLGLKDVQILNSGSKPWGPVDYASSWSEYGNENYLFYLKLKDDYNLPHEVMVRFCIGNKGELKTRDFREGKLVVADRNEALQLCCQLADIKKFYGRATTKLFGQAFRRIALSPYYDHKRMVRKVECFGESILKDAISIAGYMGQLEAVLNHKAGRREPIVEFYNKGNVLSN
jgi:hypothetical protein